VTVQLALILALGIPTAGALAVALLHRWPNLREAATLGTGVLLFADVVYLARETGGARNAIDVELVEIFPGLPLAFSLEPLGLLFALIASGLWIVTSLYAIGYMRAHDEKSQTRFYVCFAIAIAATMGIALARNLLTLFLFYEVLTLSTYPLVTHHRTENARRAGRVYLGVLLTTSIGMFLLGLTWVWWRTGTLEFTPGGILAGTVDGRELVVLLAVFAFGTGKAALMPFHRWLPAAMVAPTPVSALLHAVAVVKAGVFTILKIVIYIFGIDLLADTGASIWLMYVAGFTIVAASVVALGNDNLKARLAYSTISPLAYIVLGAALATSAGILGGGMHMLMHAFGKITLFFCAGAIYITAHKTEISDMRGIGRTMPITLFAFLIGSLSIIGLPPFGGSWSKWYLLLGTAQAHQAILMAVLLVSSLLNVAYLMPIVMRGFFPDPDADPAAVTIKEAPALCLVPLCFTALACLVLFFFADAIRELLLPIVGG
jgi:multicomponent Na+:H+ antiporter subunit D